MIVKISFGTISKIIKSLDPITEFIISLENAGYVFGDELSGIQNEIITSQIQCYSTFTLEEASTDYYVSSELKKLKIFFGQLPILEFESPIEIQPKFKSRIKSILLYSNYLSKASPLVNPLTGVAIPLFQLPLSYDTKVRLLYWQTMYRSADTLFMLGHKNIELTNYRLISEHNSELMTTARELAKSVETETKIPTYVYLHRYYAFKLNNDENFPCPICGKIWESCEQLKTKIPYVEKICIDCRLMSCKGVSIEGKRKALIGTK